MILFFKILWMNKNTSPDMQMDLELVPVFLYLYSIYLVVMLPSKMTFFHNMFCFISFPCELLAF